MRLLSLGAGMRRRKFLGLVGIAAVWPSVSARAQPLERMRRIGLLMTSTENDPLNQARIATFIAGLKERGWTENQSFRLETSGWNLTLGAHA